MKKSLLLLCFVISLLGCEPFNNEVNFTKYSPILLTRENLNKSVSLQPKTDIGDPAKIYYKDNYIFISERYKGVHIINNANPSSPVNKGYISIPGCLDMAIKENILYVDNAVDLIAIDLNEIQKGNLNLVKRIENVFPETTPPDGGVIPEKFNQQNRPANSIIIGWKKL